MNDIPLPGLIGTHPLGAMAAFGLLRAATQVKSLGEVRLSWQFRPKCHAVLHTGKACTSDTLVEVLLERQRARHTANFLNWSDDIKVAPTEFASRVTNITDREEADFFAAFGSEMVLAPSTGDVKPTAFHMTAGQKKFLKSARELAESLDPTQLLSARQKPDQRLESCRGAFSEALFGPWRYQDSEHSLGWDPGTEALHAFSAAAPTDAGPASVRAAVWLAFESLPLFPCVPVGSRLRTAGFDREGERFVWPLWNAPISLPVLRSLLTCPQLFEHPLSAVKLREQGICAVYASRCVRDANGKGTLRNALPLLTALEPTD